MSRSAVTVTCLSALCALPVTVGAQAQPSSVAAAPPYEDRLIEGGTLTPDVSAAGAAAHDDSGWPRAFRLQAIASRVTRNSVDEDEDGLRLGGMLEMPNLGAFTLEGTLRRSDGVGSDSGGMLTLYQIGLPMDGGWLVNNGLGVLNSPALDLARSQYRFFVPTILNNGLATEWRSVAGWQLHASVGQPGQLSGLYVPTFDGLGGSQLSGGAQWSGAGGWSAGIQAVSVRDSSRALGTQTDTARISTQSALAAASWHNDVSRMQLNLVNSAVDGEDGKYGAWLDAALDTGRLRHNAGAFRLDEDLAWGTQAMASDLQGGYYRATFQSRQWLLDGGADYVTPTTGKGADTLYLTGYSRYQFSSRLGFGGGANLRDSDSTAWSAYGFVDQQNPWGIGRSQLDFATDDQRSDLQLTLNQTWRTPPSTRFGSSMTVGREDLDGATTTIVGLALNGGGNPRSNLALDFDLRWDIGSGSADYDNLLANLAVSWNFRHGWNLGANYYASHRSGRLPLEVASPIAGTPDVLREQFDDRGVYLNLRYEWQAGTRFAPIGGPAGQGYGNVVGILFLDENDNGRQDAGEGGAPNVAVLLDGRFIARTDRDGRFEFAAVAVGTHVVSVVTDNLPLPWTVPATGGVTVQVGVRDRSYVPIAARKFR